MVTSTTTSDLWNSDRQAAETDELKVKDTRVYFLSNMAAHGLRFDSFNPNSGDIDAYFEQLAQFLIANDLPEHADNNVKRRAILLCSIGADAYKTLSDLCLPDKPSDKSFAQIQDALSKFYKPKASKVSYRYQFNTLVQQQGQSVSDFANALKQLAAKCGYAGDALKENLRDRFICGLRSEATKTKLLPRECNFDEALKTAVSDEMTSSELKYMKGESVNNLSHSRQSHRPRHRNMGPNAKKGSQSQHSTSSGNRCERCGRSNHTKDQCFYKNTECFRCHRIGHVQSQCLSKVNDNPQRGKKEQKGKGKKAVHKLEEEEEKNEENSLDYVHSVKTISDTHVMNVKEEAILIPVTVDGHSVDMELDTGASVSVIGELEYREKFAHIPLHPSGSNLKAYTGTPIQTIGEMEVPVVFGDNEIPRDLPLVVIKADKPIPALLGRNWLRMVHLDWKSLFIKNVKSYASVQSLKEEYKDIFEPGVGKIEGVKAKLYIKEGTKPVFQKARTVPFALKEAVDCELDRMIEQDIIEPVNFSDWATPIVVVPKPDGTVRVCGDYKVTVNPNLNVDTYPIPTPEEVFHKVSGGTKFSKIDVRCAFQSLELDIESQDYVTLNTPKGLFKYKRLPYGIASSPAIWQRFIDQVLSGLDGTCAFIDDVIVTGKDDQEHLENLSKVFERFRTYNLRVKPEKCVFMANEIVYMGIRISAQGISPEKGKVDAITRAPVPTDVHQLRSWLGMVNFQAKFIPNLSSVVKPLNDLLGHKDWNWSNSCQKAFESVKKLLSQDKVLTHYDKNKEVILAVDASPYGLGAMIAHRENGLLKPIAFASRSLNTHEKNYSQLDKEALSILFGVQRFKMFLYGRHFVLYTDHQPLTRIFGEKCSIPVLAAQRLQRWALILAAFDFSIQYIPSKKNIFADALSRLPVSDTVQQCSEDILIKWVENMPVDSSEVARETRRDPILSQVLTSIQQGWNDNVNDDLKAYHEKRFQLSVRNDCILWGIRVVIPKSLRDRVLEELHLAHPGIVRMKEIMRSYVWWPNIDKDVEVQVKNCSSCAQVKSLPAAAPLMPWIWPERPWQRIHIDFAEWNKMHFLLVVDSHSKWPEIISMNSTTSHTTIIELRKLFSRYGLPFQLVSDNGPQLVSEEFEEFLKRNGVKHVRVAPYKPSSNGAVERLVQSFKRSMDAQKKSGKSVEVCLENFLLAYRSTSHATTGCSPTSLFLNREVRTRISQVVPDISRKVHLEQCRQKKNHDNSKVLREFAVGENVYVKDVRLGKWWNGVVKARTAPASYIVTCEDGREVKKHVDHIRKGHLTSSSSTGIWSDIEIQRRYEEIRRNLFPNESIETPPRVQNNNETSSETILSPSNVNDENSNSTGTSSEDVTLRRSTRAHKAPSRLIESI